MRLFADLKGTRTYATAERAERAAEDVIAQCGTDLRYLLLHANDGRVAPCFVLTNSTMLFAAGLAGKGFCVTGGG